MEGLGGSPKWLHEASKAFEATDDGLIAALLLEGVRLFWEFLQQLGFTRQWMVLSFVIHEGYSVKLIRW